MNAHELRKKKVKIVGERLTVDDVITWVQRQVPQEQTAVVTTAVIMAVNTTLEILAKEVEESHNIDVQEEDW